MIGDFTFSKQVSALPRAGPSSFFEGGIYPTLLSHSPISGLSESASKTPLPKPRPGRRLRLLHRRARRLPAALRRRWGASSWGLLFVRVFTSSDFTSIRTVSHGVHHPRGGPRAGPPHATYSALTWLRTRASCGSDTARGTQTELTHTHELVVKQYPISNAGQAMRAAGDAEKVMPEK